MIGLSLLTDLVAIRTCGNGSRRALSRTIKSFCFDYVGAGKSCIADYDPVRYARLEGYVQDVLDVCDALEIQVATFVGHSVSAMIGAGVAIERPELFPRIAMIGPSPRYIDEPPDYVGGFSQEDIEGLLDLMDKNYMGWAHTLAPVIMKNDDQPEFADELEASFCSTDPYTARQFAKVTFLSDCRDWLPKIPAHCLIMQCADDVIAPLSIGDYLAANIPDNTLVHMSANGHCPHVSHPQETIQLLKDYLGSSV